MKQQSLPHQIRWNYSFAVVDYRGIAIVWQSQVLARPIKSRSESVRETGQDVCFLPARLGFLHVQDLLSLTHGAFDR